MGRESHACWGRRGLPLNLKESSVPEWEDSALVLPAQGDAREAGLLTVGEASTLPVLSQPSQWPCDKVKARPAEAQWAQMPAASLACDEGTCASGP